MRARSLDLIVAALDREADHGRVVDIWWRDDDAVRDGPALDRLLALAARFSAPLAIATIASRIEPSLPARLREEPRVNVLAHGYEHANHARPGEKPSEYGGHRPLAAIADELTRARTLVESAFAAQSWAVFAPPWNRIAQAVEALLPAAGYVGISAFGPAPPNRATDLLRIDTHLDPVDWRGGRSLFAAEPIAVALAAALAEETRPIGLLTHHLVFDEALWAWCEALLERLSEHSAVRLRSLDESMADAARPMSLSCGPPYGKLSIGFPLRGGVR